MNNGMDDNAPDVCKICHHIISPEEDAPEDICEKCQTKKLYDAKCAEAEKMRGTCRRAYFALMDWDGPIQDTAILNLLREMYETCSLAEAGKPLLDKMVALEQENARLQQEVNRLEREMELALAAPIAHVPTNNNHGSNLK